MAKVIGKVDCPECGSEKKLCKYADGGQHCHSCNYHVHAPAEEDDGPEPLQLFTGSCRALPNAKLSADVCRKYGVTVAKHKGQPVVVYPWVERGTVVAQTAVTGSDFSFDVGQKHKIRGLWGKQTCRGSGKMLVITDDKKSAMSVCQSNDLKYDAVSTSGGSGGAVEDFEIDSEFIAGYERVVLMFSQDEDAQSQAVAAAEKCIPGTAFIASLSERTANEMLQAGKFAELKSAQWGAKAHSPAGIVTGEEVYERAKARGASPRVANFPWQGMNEVTRGIYESQVITLGAGSGMGKSELVGELQYSLLKQGVRIGVMALEEGCERSQDRLVGFELEQRVYLEDETTAVEGYDVAYHSLGLANIPYYDSWGSMDGDELINKMRGMHFAHGCKVIFLDHISIVVSGNDLTSDERRTIDNVMTKIRSLCEETGLVVVIACHMNQPTGTPLEEGGKTSLKLLRGSRAIGQLSDLVFGMERDQQDDDPIKRSTTDIRMLKNRRTGETGICCSVVWSKDTGRMVEKGAMEMFALQITPKDEGEKDGDSSHWSE